MNVASLFPGLGFGRKKRSTAATFEELYNRWIYEISHVLRDPTTEQSYTWTISETANIANEAVYTREDNAFVLFYQVT